MFVIAITRCIDCTYATPSVHMPDALPNFSAEGLTLGDVKVVNNGKEVPPVVTAHVREATREILAKAADDRDEAGRAKIDVSVDLQEDKDLFAHVGQQDGCAALPLPFLVLGGVKTESAKLTVDVTVRARGRTFQGHGVGHKEGSIYIAARRRALAVALDRALSDAAASEKADQPPHGSTEKPNAGGMVLGSHSRERAPHHNVSQRQ